MGRNSQRKKERHEQRRKEKRKQQARAQQRSSGPRDAVPIGSNVRHRQRISQQKPSAWLGELPEDVAIFDDAAHSALAPELASQATAVREALRDALALRGNDALKQVSSIPRESPFSEWRLFLRGLIEWLANNPGAADEAWKRLSPDRRPGRIATAMMLSRRTDLETAVPRLEQPAIVPPVTALPGAEQPVAQAAGAESSGPEGRSAATSAVPWERFDAQQLYHAKLLRRTRFDRIALRIAETGLRVQEERIEEGAEELLLGEQKIHWLKQFIAEYGDTEPALAEELAQMALRRASAQPYGDLFNLAVRAFSGPRHDRGNTLLTYLYFGKFADDVRAERLAGEALQTYLTRDLPQNQSLTDAVKGAIASQLHLIQAEELIETDRGHPLWGHPLFGRMFQPPDDGVRIRKHLAAAVKAAPANGPAYKAHVDWLETMLENDRLGKSDRTKLERELQGVMCAWSKGVPDEAEPRLWLVDFYLENEQLEEARPHVEFLSASRTDDPLVRAMPWKWQMLEAMRLCRRKAWLADVPARLDEAEALWPAWLSTEWLPYLRAALALRAGRMDEYEERRGRIVAETGRVRDSLADACLMLGAAQSMRGTPAELKPLRAAADAAITKVSATALNDLIDLGSVFWDLQRAKLLYPAYRNQGKAVGMALLGELKRADAEVLERLEDKRFQNAILWESENRFWMSIKNVKIPDFLLKRTIKEHPIVVAASLNALLLNKHRWGIEKHWALGPILRAAAPAQRDAFYRFWFVDLADELDDAIADESRRLSEFGFRNPVEFDRPEIEIDDENDDDDDYDDDDDDYDDDDIDIGHLFDPDCECPICSTIRKAQKRASSYKSLFP